MTWMLASCEFGSLHVSLAFKPLDICLGVNLYKWQYAPKPGYPFFSVFFHIPFFVLLTEWSTHDAY